jgi:hypothetical protein
MFVRPVYCVHCPIRAQIYSLRALVSRQPSSPNDVIYINTAVSLGKWVLHFPRHWWSNRKYVFFNELTWLGLRSPFTPSYGEVSIFRKVTITNSPWKSLVEDADSSSSSSSSSSRTSSSRLRSLSPRANYTERSPLVGEVTANFLGKWVSRGQRDGTLRP